MKFNIGLTVLLSFLLLGACGSGTQKGEQGLGEGSGEIVSLAGSWRLDNQNERATWTFDAQGNCELKPVGLVKQKGKYQYDGKNLILDFASGRTSYSVLEKIEPNLVIMMRWGDMYNITNKLTRLQ